LINFEEIYHNRPDILSTDNTEILASYTTATDSLDRQGADLVFSDKITKKASMKFCRLKFSATE
jgi:hypothetical protein